MIRRGLFLLALGSVLGVLFATFLGPQPAHGEEAPGELRAPPAQPTRTAKDLSQPMIKATRAVRPAVVEIVLSGRNWRGNDVQLSSGSGFFISRKGHILTNRHVLAVRGANRIEVKLFDGRTFSRVKILGTDQRSDVAVLRILGLDDQDVAIAPLGDSDQLEVGELVLAIGAPYKLASSVSLGIVSATGRTGLIANETASEDFIQTDAALNPGNSGGPLVNMDGQVVGINTSIMTKSQSNAGVGFSIPINLARSIAVALIERGTVKRGYLGVRGNLVAQSGSSKAEGYKIQAVVPDSPAAKAGLQPQDVIVAMDGRPLKDIRIFYSELTQAGPGGRVKLSVKRGGALRSINVNLGEAPKRSGFGIEVESLTPARARQLELPRTSAGVVVTKLQENSVAANAEESNRLLPGDVIVRIDWPGGRHFIRDEQDFNRVMEHFENKPPREVHLIVQTKEGLFRVRLRPHEDS